MWSFHARSFSGRRVGSATGSFNTNREPQGNVFYREWCRQLATMRAAMARPRPCPGLLSNCGEKVCPCLQGNAVAGILHADLTVSDSSCARVITVISRSEQFPALRGIVDQIDDDAPQQSCIRSHGQQIFRQRRFQRDAVESAGKTSTASVNDGVGMVGAVRGWEAHEL